MKKSFLFMIILALIACKENTHPIIPDTSVPQFTYEAYILHNDIGEFHIILNNSLVAVLVGSTGPFSGTFTAMEGMNEFYIYHAPVGGTNSGVFYLTKEQQVYRMYVGK
ncbi:MAG: hypothetical protein HW421_750 [Ignavibacteria bacterium]|nr:hypothetical protein [Ignavibacteria bacterium]